MKILGHEFRLMTEQDYEGLAGAEEHSWICELEDSVLVWTPAKDISGSPLLSADYGKLSELYADGEKQRDWTPQGVL